MRTSEIIDFIQKKINSLLFRSIVIVYAVLIISLYNNVFPYYVYIIVLVVYLFFYLITLIKNKDKLRLINDFFLIFIITYEKNINDAFIFTFLLLPIFNSINFSGRKKSILLYILTAFTYVLLVVLHTKNISVDIVFHSFIPISGIIFLFIIDYYTTLRLKIKRFREILNDTVDDFYINKDFIRKPFKIYDKIIETINNYIKNDLIEELFCFEIRNNKLILLNGSKFIWKYELPDNNISFLRILRKNGVMLDTKIRIDNRYFENTLFIYTNIEKNEYVYLFVAKNSIPLYYKLIGFFRTLKPPMYRMSKILISEKKLQELKKIELEKISARSQYVTKAVKTMHFIRNRLGPFKNLTKMIENNNKIISEKKKAFYKILFKENARTKIELKEIIDRANFLLEKSNNPFNFSDIYPISIQNIFSILRTNYQQFFSNNEIEIILNNLAEIHSINKYKILLNEEGFRLFLSDWFNNMQKYSNNLQHVIFSISKNDIQIIFQNDTILPDNMLDSMIIDLNQNDRNEIMKRTTHGLYQIKSSLEDMKIKYNIVKLRKNELTIIELTIKLNKYENSSI